MLFYKSFYKEVFDVIKTQYFLCYRGRKKKSLKKQYWHNANTMTIIQYFNE